MFAAAVAEKQSEIPIHLTWHLFGSRYRLLQKVAQKVALCSLVLKYEQKRRENVKKRLLNYLEIEFVYYIFAFSNCMQDTRVSVT